MWSMDFRAALCAGCVTMRRARGVLRFMAPHQLNRRAAHAIEVEVVVEAGSTHIRHLSVEYSDRMWHSALDTFESLSYQCVKVIVFTPCVCCMWHRSAILPSLPDDRVSAWVWEREPSCPILAC